MTIHDDVLSTVSLEFSAIAREKSLSGQKIISLGLGEPGFDTPSEIVEAAYRSMMSGESRYSSPWGLPELISLINNHIEAATGLMRNQFETMVTAGAKQSLSLALLSILQQGDEVVVFSPCYVSFKPQILLAEYGAKIVELNLNENFDVNINELNLAIGPKTRAVLFNFPNNPTGKNISYESQSRIVDICKRHGIFILSDEIYSQLSFSGQCFSSFGSFWNSYDRIFVIDGFSKAYSMTGWRIGYLSGPEEFLRKCVTVQQHTITNIPIFIQRGAIAALTLINKPSISYNKHLADNEEYLHGLISSVQGLEYVRSQGGMFAFIKIDGTYGGSDQFCARLLEKYSVAVTPGKSFGKNWDRYIRISLGVTRDQFKEGVDLIVKFVRERSS